MAVWIVMAIIIPCAVAVEEGPHSDLLQGKECDEKLCSAQFQKYLQVGGSLVVSF
jgi:hypothetical protein